jgi:hypothetical protein
MRMIKRENKMLARFLQTAAVLVTTAIPPHSAIARETQSLPLKLGITLLPPSPLHEPQISCYAHALGYEGAPLIVLYDTKVAGNINGVRALQRADLLVKNVDGKDVKESFAVEASLIGGKFVPIVVAFAEYEDSPGGGSKATFGRGNIESGKLIISTDLPRTVTVSGSTGTQTINQDFVDPSARKAIDDRFAAIGRCQLGVVQVPAQK